MRARRTEVNLLLSRSREGCRLVLTALDIDLRGSHVAADTLVDKSRSELNITGCWYNAPAAHYWPHLDPCRRDAPEAG